MKLTETSCQVCKSNDYEILYKGKGRFDIEVNVSICRKCGFMYLNPRMSSKEYLEYNQKYDELHSPEVFKQKVDNEINTTKVKAIVEKMGEHFPKQVQAVLDIGCSSGHTLEYLKTLFPRAVMCGIESSKYALNKLQDKSIQVISENVESDWDKEFSFDLIIMRHSLEHFLNPLDVLKKVSNVLTKNGVVYIAVPNSYDPSLPMKYFFSVAHPYMFSITSLQNMVDMAGLGIVFSSYDRDSNELFMVCCKAEPMKPTISKHNYEFQKKIISTLIKKEKTLLSKLKWFIGGLIK